MIRVLVVIGTRPEAIKLCPVVACLQRESTQFHTRVVATHQHAQMLDQVLNIFKIRPDYDLKLMRHNQTLNEVAWKLLCKIEPILAKEQPHIVLVQGDTVTACLAGLASFYSRLSVGHVEAGLRTGDRYRPYPEEMNRRLLGVVANFHFAPTLQAVANLQREGISADRIHLTGNTVVDALHTILAQQPPTNELAHLGQHGRMILVTAHRRENFGEPLRAICQALITLVERNSDVEVVYPVHLNPHVRSVVFELLGGKPRVHLLDPLDYISFVHLMSRSTLILTDSGGIQEEAPSLGKPVLILRSKTERSEVVEVGVGELVGTNTAVIVDAAQRLLDDPEEYIRRARVTSPFGDGHARERIVKILLEQFGGGLASAYL